MTTNETIALTTPAQINTMRLMTFARGMAFEIVTGMKMTRGNIWQTAAYQGLITGKTRFTPTQRKTALREIVALIQESYPDYEVTGYVKKALDA